MASKSVLSRSVLAALALAITLLFLAMIRGFLIAVLLAALFAAMMRPLYRRSQTVFGRRDSLAAAATTLVMALVVVLPLLGLVGIVVGQAIDVGRDVTPWIQENLSNRTALEDSLRGLPFYEKIAPYQGQIVERVGSVVGIVSGWVVDGLSAATSGTANALFAGFVFLYTTFFLLRDGHALTHRILYYLPLEAEEETILIHKLNSVFRALVKGTLLIGLLQGTLAGIAFAVAGIDNAVFWGTIMVVLSIIPAVGSSIVWLPAGIVLLVQGHTLAGIALMIFCGLVVGSLDNVLRPQLIGKDTAMHELLTFFGTVGGVMMFGMAGVLIGPLVAALFVSIWELYGVAFADLLPEVGRMPDDSDPPDLTESGE